MEESNRKDQKQTPSWCPHGKHDLWCQDCEEYYYEGLGYCGITNPKKEKPKDSN